MFVAIHTLFTAIGNSNRDLHGHPKEIMFGGRRQRISSQSWSRAVRLLIRDMMKDDLPDFAGVRTRHLPSYIAAQIDPDTISDAERAAIMEVAARIGTKTRADAESEEEDEPDDAGEAASAPSSALRTAQMMYFTRREARAIADAMTRAVKDGGVSALRGASREKVLELIGPIAEPHGLDIALFGRMTTNSPLKDVSAALYRAHAIGVHRMELEFDFYTAMDDVEAQAGYLDTAGTPFAATTYYLFAALDTRILLENLGGDRAAVLRAVDLLLNAWLSASPPGMRSRFGQFPRASFAMLEVTTGGEQPINYVDAFLTPVRGTADRGVDIIAREKLVAHGQTMCRMHEIATGRAYLADAPFAAGQLLQHNHRPDTEDVPDATYCPTRSALARWLTGHITEAMA